MQAAAHEAGHKVAARQKGVELGTPLFVPAGLGFLGSFGAITSFRSTLPNRAALLHVAAYGPAFGAAASLAMLLVGLGLSAGGVGGAELQPAAFQDSLLVGILGQALERYCPSLLLFLCHPRQGCMLAHLPNIS